MAAVNVPQQQWMDGSDGHVAMLIDVVMMMRSMVMLLPAAAPAQELYVTGH